MNAHVRDSLHDIIYGRIWGALAMVLSRLKMPEKCRAKVAAFCLYIGRDIVQGGRSRPMSRTKE